MTTREHYSHTITDGKKRKRRKDVETRQKSRKRRTAKQQLNKLDIEGRIAKKDRIKLKSDNNNRRK